MIVRNNERRIDTMENMLGGPGSAIFKRIIQTPEELYGKGRVFSVLTLEKNCGVGYHVHQGDGEFYLILSGEAEYNDNGEVTTLREGDFSFTDAGEGHAITNLRDEPATVLALVLYK